MSLYDEIEARTEYSFNRYMVECELSTVGLVNELITVLIDTWWNVNVSAIKKPLGDGTF